MSRKNRNRNQEQQEQEVQDFVEEQQIAESYEEATEEVVEDVQEEATEEAQEAQEEVVEEEQGETPATSNTGTMDSVVELDSVTKEVKEVPVSGDAFHDNFVRSEVDRRAEERLRLMR